MDSDNKNYELIYCPTVLKMMNIECTVNFVINFLSKDIIKNILNQELTQIISKKDNN